MHSDGRALCDDGLDRDRAARLLDDPVRGRESETGPFALRLGREEWLERPGDHFL
jgi:hypothetical protein